MRPLDPEDIRTVAELHQRAFGPRRRHEELATFLTEILFGHPWRDESLPSLAYVDRDGRVVGCLGSMPRPMMLGDRPVRAVVTHNFMVDPAHRGGLAALHLMRAMIANGADLMLADSNDAGRRICEALGGTTLPARAGRWLRVLRPAELSVQLLRRGRKPSAFTRALGGMARLPDALVTRIPGLPLRVRATGARDAALQPADLPKLVAQLTGLVKLRPVYTEDSAAWLLDMLRRTRREQTLRLAKVEDGGEVLGWYVYYSRPGSIGRVLQLGAMNGARRLVLEHLFSDALGEGNVGVSGQADPAWTTALTAASCLFRPGRTSFVIHTPDEDLGRTLASPDAFLSRLEGEGWLQFGY